MTPAMLLVDVKENLSGKYTLDEEAVIDLFLAMESYKQRLLELAQERGKPVRDQAKRIQTIERLRDGFETIHKASSYGDRITLTIEVHGRRR